MRYELIIRINRNKQIQKLKKKKITKQEKFMVLKNSTNQINFILFHNIQFNRVAVL